MGMNEILTSFASAEALARGNDSADIFAAVDALEKRKFAVIAARKEMLDFLKREIVGKRHRYFDTRYGGIEFYSPDGNCKLTARSDDHEPWFVEGYFEGRHFHNNVCLQYLKDNVSSPVATVDDVIARKSLLERCEAENLSLEMFCKAVVSHIRTKEEKRLAELSAAGIDPSKFVTRMEFVVTKEL